MNTVRYVHSTTITRTKPSAASPTQVLEPSWTHHPSSIVQSAQRIHVRKGKHTYDDCDSQSSIRFGAGSAVAGREDCQFVFGPTGLGSLSRTRRLARFGAVRLPRNHQKANGSGDHQAQARTEAVPECRHVRTRHSPRVEELHDVQCRRVGFLAAGQGIQQAIRRPLSTHP